MKKKFLKRTVLFVVLLAISFLVVWNLVQRYQQGYYLPKSYFDNITIPVEYQYSATGDFSRVFTEKTSYESDIPRDETTFCGWYKTKGGYSHEVLEEKMKVKLPAMDASQGKDTVISLGRKIIDINYALASQYQIHSRGYVYNDWGNFHPPMAVATMSKEYYPNQIFVYSIDSIDIIVPDNNSTSWVMEG